MPPTRQPPSGSHGNHFARCDDGGFVLCPRHRDLGSDLADGLVEGALFLVFLALGQVILAQQPEQPLHDHPPRPAPLWLGLALLV